MFFLYSIVYTLAFLIMLPAVLLRRQKYAAGFRERLGNYPPFEHDDRKIIWLHCVSVGETNAARPLVDALREQFPSYRIIVSTTTKTGQQLAKRIFADKADAVFYFPFDWKFSVRRALRTFKPSLILLMETEIWPRLIHEVKRSGARLAIVNGRLSERSFRRYSVVRSFIRRVLQNIDLALMQSPNDVERIESLGLEKPKTSVTENLKFDIEIETEATELTEYFRERFGINGEKLLVVAASTHELEEKWIVDSLDAIVGDLARLIVVPRHPERFNEVAWLLSKCGHTSVRRSRPATDSDRSADIILLDSIGELRGLYPLADIVFVGGSLVPHGGQSILEPAAAGKAIITGSYTHNFSDAVNVFLRNEALIQIPDASPVDHLSDAFSKLLKNEELRGELGRNAFLVMRTNRGATARTIEQLRSFLTIHF